MMIPATVCSVYIGFCTKRTKAPENILFLFAIVAFVMSIQWVSFLSNFVVDLLALLGLMLSLPKPLLGLTLLAWGNCLGDLNANVAMTKKGFGEMALTGCMAGPVFNVFCGLGASCVLMLIGDPTRFHSHCSKRMDHWTLMQFCHLVWSAPKYLLWLWYLRTLF